MFEGCKFSLFTASTIRPGNPVEEVLEGFFFPIPGHGTLINCGGLSD